MKSMRLRLLLNALFCGLLMTGPVACATDEPEVNAAAKPQQLASNQHESVPAKPLIVVDENAGGPYVAGKHYEVLSSPADTGTTGAIEVMEVFWYGCPHCYNFEALITAWKKTAPDDVVFRRTPAIWDKQGIMKHHATVYYVAESLDVLDKVHTDIFELLTSDRRLTNQDRFIEIFEKHGVSKEEYLKYFSSFSIVQKVKAAEKRVQANYRVQGTPEMVVNGKYRVSGRMAGSQAGMLSVVDFLINKEREQAAQ